MKDITDIYNVYTESKKFNIKDTKEATKVLLRINQLKRSRYKNDQIADIINGGYSNNPVNMDMIKYALYEFDPSEAVDMGKFNSLLTGVDTGEKINIDTDKRTDTVDDDKRSYDDERLVNINTVGVPKVGDIKSRRRSLDKKEIEDDEEFKESVLANPEDELMLESIYHGMIQERKRLSDYETKHETFHSVVGEITDYLERNGVVSDEFSNHMFTGGIGYGENTGYTFEIDSVKGKNTRKGLQVQVYRGDNGIYELNMYVL
jgi:hypothetical protein